MKENKKFKFPHIHEYLVVITMLLVACLLTYLIPAGEYAREMVDGKETVIADGFHFIEQSPVSPFKMLNMIYQGFVKQANLIFTL